MKNYRGTFVEIDLKAIQHNIEIIKKMAPSSKILVAIKANAYGHGAIETSNFIQKENLADCFGVSSIEEGIELRQSSIVLPILILGLILPENESIIAAIDNNLTISIADIQSAKSISAIAKLRNVPVKAQIKVDSGMGRIGCSPANALELAKTINSLPGIVLEGIFSHMPVSDEIDNTFNEAQIKLFKKTCREIEDHGIVLNVKHLANSAAIINFKESHLDMVRPGIMTYGYHPSPELRGTGIIPSMTLKSRVVFSKRVKAGTGISYGLTYTTSVSTNIITIPVGYADGLSRFLSNKGQVIIHNKIYPYAGKVCMDQILVDTGDDVFEPGTEVTLFGNEIITAETIADLIGTIPYEVTCNISKRVPKMYCK